MEDLKGNVCTEKDQIIRSVNIAVSDMQEFTRKREWDLMKDSVMGWLNRKLLPSHNM